MIHEYFKKKYSDLILKPKKMTLEQAIIILHRISYFAHKYRSKTRMRFSRHGIVITFAIGPRRFNPFKTLPIKLRKYRILIGYHDVTIRCISLKTGRRYSLKKPIRIFCSNFEEKE